MPQFRLQLAKAENCGKNYQGRAKFLNKKPLDFSDRAVFFGKVTNLARRIDCQPITQARRFCLSPQ
jgi:hypothetical protein